MTYANTTTQTAVPSRLSTWIELLRTRMERRRVFRRTLSELRALTPRELADLGLHPTMLTRIAYQAAYENNPEARG